MSIYTFSTRSKKPVDTELVERAKKHCDDNGLNFSAFIIQLLRQWEIDHDKRPTKV